MSVPVQAHLSPTSWFRAPIAALRRVLSRRRHDREVTARLARADEAGREAARALHEAIRASQAAQKTREELLARMSHELRTPLNAVIGFAKVLESNRAGNQRPEDREMLSRIRANGERLLGIVDDVLSHTEVTSGQLILAPDPADVAVITARVLETHSRAAHSKGLRLVVDLPASAPAIPLDARRLEQVLDKLVDNAVKFTPTGEVRVRLHTDSMTRKPTSLVVEDTGIGIPADRLHSVFEPFEQADAGRSRAYGGAGLGLPLAYRLCEAMGCALEVQSILGRGSTFSVRFPS
jgi:signal transduction histidine kinase